MTRIVTALAVLLLSSPSWASAFPSGTSAADAPWGQPLDGFSCHLSAPSEVRQGDTLSVVLEMRHDGANHGTITHIVDWRTGSCTNDWWRDVGRPVDPDTFLVPTLGDDGDQLPTGRRPSRLFREHDPHPAGVTAG